MPVTDTINESNAAAIIAATADIHPLHLIIDGVEDGQPASEKRKWLIHKDGWKLQEITEPTEQPAPKFLNQSVTVNTQGSLVDYVGRYKTSASMLFANVGDNTVTAVLDYHYPSHDGAPLERREGVAPPDAKPEVPAKANRALHSAVLELITSEEWDAWTGIDGRMMPQLEFSRFIEENMGGIKTPDGATILELARTLQVTRNFTWKGSVRTDSNHQDLNYQEVTSSGAGRDGSAPVPVYFDLWIPVFFAGAYSDMRAFVRHEVADGKLRIGVKLKGARKVRQDAFADVAENVRLQTDVALVYGGTD